jgi:hypothetical protein
MPTTFAETTSPIEVVGEWLQNLMDPDVVERIVAPDATYVSLNTENAELNKVMPWAGTSHGPQAFLDRLGEMFSRWENQGLSSGWVRFARRPRTGVGRRPAATHPAAATTTRPPPTGSPRTGGSRHRRAAAAAPAARARAAS